MPSGSGSSVTRGEAKEESITPAHHTCVSKSELNKPSGIPPAYKNSHISLNKETPLPGGEAVTML